MMLSVLRLDIHYSCKFKLLRCVGIIPVIKRQRQKNEASGARVLAG